MNRSLRAAVAPSPGRTMTKQADEELALFLEMRKLEKEQNNLLLHSTAELDPPLGSKPGTAPIFKIASSAPAREAGIGDFLNSDSEKNDYDWLLTPPGTPLFPSLDTESKRSPVSSTGTPKNRSTLQKSRLANAPDPSRNAASRQPTTSSGFNSSTVGTRRPSSSGGPTHSASRPVTPNGRPTLTAALKPTRASTPTSRNALPSKSCAPPPRSSTPVRYSTQTSRSSVPAASKTASRSATPTRRPSAISAVPSSSAPSSRSSSVARSGSTVSKGSTPCGSSSAIKPRSLKPSCTPGSSHDAPSNSHTSLPERPSASRGRPGAPNIRSSSVEPGPNVRPRRQSCSPSRGRVPNGNVHKGSSVPPSSRPQANASDTMNPVLIGNKMVERIVNMRRLVPPKQDDQRSSHNNLCGKSSLTPDSTGFGRTLSKKSLDMALRHMDIRRSVPNSSRPSMTNIPALSVYVRSGPTRSRTVGVSDSPLATSSTASSEHSVNNNTICLDGNEIEDDLTSEKGGRCSPAVFIAR